MAEDLVDKGAEVYVRETGIDLADEVLVIPVRFFDLKAYSLQYTSVRMAPEYI